MGPLLERRDRWARNHARHGPSASLMEHREPSERVDRLARRVIGAAIEVHRHLGPGLLESAYQQALLHELQLQGMDTQRHVHVPIDYKGVVVGAYKLDFLVEEELILELKSIERFAPTHRAQLLGYLHATRLELGLLLNFNVARLKDGICRVVRGA